MSERYFCTGVQLGIIEAALLSNPNVMIQKVIDEIQEKQFISNVPQGREWKSDITIVSTKIKTRKEQ